MASFYKRKNKSGTTVWSAVIRIKGYPTVCKTFEHKQEAEDWAQDTEREMKNGQFNFDYHKNQHTFDELVDRYIQDGILEHHRSAVDTKRHLIYWKSRLGAYALVHINTALLSKGMAALIRIPNLQRIQKDNCDDESLHVIPLLSPQLCCLSSQLAQRKPGTAAKKTQSRIIKINFKIRSFRCLSFWFDSTF